jgi:hypothetical protein
MNASSLSAGVIAVLLAGARPACAEWRDLLPRGWNVDSSAEGDLNGDGLPDAAVILSRRTADGAGKEARLLVYFMRQDGGYDLHTDAPKAARFGSAEAAEPERVEGEPRIRNGVLEIRYGGGSRRSVTTRWRLKKGRFMLNGFTRKSTAAGIPVVGEIISAEANVPLLRLTETVVSEGGRVEKRTCRVPARFRDIALPGFDFGNVEPWPSCVPQRP